MIYFASYVQKQEDLRIWAPRKFGFYIIQRLFLAIFGLFKAILGVFCSLEKRELPLPYLLSAHMLAYRLDTKTVDFKFLSICT